MRKEAVGHSVATEEDDKKVKRHRRTPSQSQIIETILLQGGTVPCFRCGVPFTLEDARDKKKRIQREHLHEFELDGPDDPSNWRFSHYDCHDRVTNGAGATTAGSSKHRIAKAERIQREGKVMAMNLTTEEKRDRKDKRRGWQKLGGQFRKGYRPMVRRS